MPEKNYAKTLKILAIAGMAIAGAGFAAIYYFFGRQLLVFFSDPVEVKAWLDQFGIWSKIVFVAIRAFQTVIKIIPAEPLEIGSGYAFGTWGGLLYCMLGTFIGSLVILLLMKIFGVKLLYLFVSKEKIESYAFLKDNKKLGTTLFFIYLIPGTPKDLITYLIAFTPMKKSLFMLITSIARIPAIVTSTWCGAKLVEQDYKMAAIIFGVTTVVSLAAMFAYRQYEKKRKAKERASDEAVVGDQMQTEDDSLREE